LIVTKCNLAGVYVGGQGFISNMEKILKAILLTTFVLIPTIFIGSFGCGCLESTASSRLIPADTARRIELDAIMVAHNMRATESEIYLKDSIEVPVWARIPIASAMEAVWRSRSKARDTVIEIYAIRPGSWMNFHEIILSRRIDETRFRELLDSFGLYLKKPSQGLTIFRTDSAVNTLALSRLLADSLSKEVYTKVEPNGYFGGGNQVKARLEADGVLLEYSIGYGDCPAGCGEHRIWTFKVFRDGQAKFLGVRGDPPYDPSKRRP
jgi:hypothetical protein